MTLTPGHLKNNSESPSLKATPTLRNRKIHFDFNSDSSLDVTLTPQP